MKIKLRKKRKLSELDPEDLSVSEAISTIYNADEDIWLVDLDWNGFLIPLDDYAVAGMFGDITYMLNKINEGESRFNVSFLESIFTAIWSITIEEEKIKIEAAWTDIIGPENGQEKPLDQLRKVSDTVIMSKKDFIDEWTKLLIKLKEDLVKVGYNNSLEDWEDLEKCSQIR